MMIQKLITASHMSIKQVSSLMDQSTDVIALGTAAAFWHQGEYVQRHWEMCQFWTIFKPYTEDAVIEFLYQSPNLAKDGRALVSVNQWDMRNFLVLLEKKILSYQKEAVLLPAAIFGSQLESDLGWSL